ncbi:MAG: hypothetical protein IJO55_03890 [Lachnospiraceae bacterium]|nr:hypothetical protein [Lachnospiraceae bacterium]
MSKVFTKALDSKGAFINPADKEAKIAGYAVYDPGTGKRLGTAWLENRVKEEPVISAGKMSAFRNYVGVYKNIDMGTKLLYLTSSSCDSAIMPNLVTIVDDYSHHFMVDTGKYRMSVNKSSVYCKTEGLYLFESAE